MLWINVFYWFNFFRRIWLCFPILIAILIVALLIVRCCLLALCCNRLCLATSARQCFTSVQLLDECEVNNERALIWWGENVVAINHVYLIIWVSFIFTKLIIKRSSLSTCHSKPSYWTSAFESSIPRFIAIWCTVLWSNYQKIHGVLSISIVGGHNTK